MKYYKNTQLVQKKVVKKEKEQRTDETNGKQISR